MYATLFSRRKRNTLIAGFALFLSVVLFSYPKYKHYLKLSVRDYQYFSRVIIEPSFPLSFDIEKSSSLLLIKIGTDVSFRIQKEAFKSRLIESFGWIKGTDYYILTVKTKAPNFSYDYFSLKKPSQLIIDFSQRSEIRRKEQDSLRGKEASEKKRAPLVASSPLTQAKNPSSSLQGIKTIVIDPGHGGLETGAKGKFGTQEKEITLAISLRLKAIIERNLAFRIVLTRDKDVDVSLDNRAALANNNKAQLFISIHTNSSYRKEARGPETFFLSMNATDEEARRLAYLENNLTEFKERIAGENEDALKMILWDMAQAAYLKESSLLAESIQRELNLLLGTVNRGVKQAPFKVLTGVACPAVLIEVAFISNPQEEKKLLSERFQSNVAQAIYRGLVNYIRRYSQE